MERTVELSHGVLAFVAPYINILEIHRILCAREKAREKSKDGSLHVIDFLIMGLISRVSHGEGSIYAPMQLTDLNGLAFSFQPFVDVICKQLDSDRDVVGEYLRCSIDGEAPSITEFRDAMATYFGLKEGDRSSARICELLGNAVGYDFYKLLIQAESQNLGGSSQESLAYFGANAGTNPRYAFLADIYRRWRMYVEVGASPVTPYPSVLAHICYDVALRLADQGLVGPSNLDFLFGPEGALLGCDLMSPEINPFFDCQNDRGIFKVMGKRFYLLQMYLAHTATLHIEDDQKPLLTLTINREGWRGLSGQVVSTILANIPADAMA